MTLRRCTALVSILRTYVNNHYKNGLGIETACQSRYSLWFQAAVAVSSGVKTGLDHLNRDAASLNNNDNKIATIEKRLTITPTRPEDIALSDAFIPKAAGRVRDGN